MCPDRKSAISEAFPNCGFIEAGTGGVLYKQVFLKISQNSQENTCARVSFLTKLQVFY